MKQRNTIHLPSKVTTGLDVADRRSEVCILHNRTAEVLWRGKIDTTPAGLTEFFGKLPPSRVAFEVGCHSPWINDLLLAMGHETLVANPRQLALITRSQRKTDQRDAEMLARLARSDPKLLRPIRHRSRDARLDLTTLRTRNQLVGTRTHLICSIRGTVKSFGARIRSMDAKQFHRHAAEDIPADVLPRIAPLLRVLEALAEELATLRKEVRRLCREGYPETALLMQIPRVGEITALTFLLTIEDPKRFAKSEDVGAYLGLTPKRAESGDRAPELSITKAGDREVRRLLVQCAHQVLSRHAPPSDIREWGLALAARGKKKAKRRAVVAVARKLAVLMHRLWVSGEVYRPKRDVA